MKKWYVMLTVALAAVLLFSACAIVNGGTANQKNHFVKLKLRGSETAMVLNVDQIEAVFCGKDTNATSGEITELWSIHLISRGADNRAITYYIDDRENAARLYEAMGLTLD